MGLSFLPEAPKKGAQSRTIIGFLPVGEDVGLEDFRENTKFMYVCKDLGRDRHFRCSKAAHVTDRIFVQ